MKNKTTRIFSIIFCVLFCCSFISCNSAMVAVPETLTRMRSEGKITFQVMDTAQCESFVSQIEDEMQETLKGTVVTGYFVQIKGSAEETCIILEFQKRSDATLTCEAFAAYSNAVDPNVQYYIYNDKVVIGGSKDLTNSIIVELVKALK
ncbi:MAG: hypothetical protein IJY39_08845 [Clostridia bacterium]|nr:hypothetical protein [Clostridia bacterium]